MCVCEKRVWRDRRGKVQGHGKRKEEHEGERWRDLHVYVLAVPAGTLCSVLLDTESRKRVVVLAHERTHGGGAAQREKNRRDNRETMNTQGHTVVESNTTHEPFDTRPREIFDSVKILSFVPRF